MHGVFLSYSFKHKHIDLYNCNLIMDTIVSIYCTIIQYIDMNVLWIYQYIMDIIVQTMFKTNIKFILIIIKILLAIIIVSYL